jgi:hypothetical protein
MGVDRFITWNPANFKGPPPTLERLAKIAQDFLGDRWEVRETRPDWLVCQCEDKMTFPLASEYPEDDSFRIGAEKDYASRTRGFEVFFRSDLSKQTSIITRRADEFTDALAAQYTRILARWWGAEVQWPS